MCFADKCCRYFSLEAGCLLIGGISFVGTTVFLILSAIGFFYVSTSEVGNATTLQAHQWRVFESMHYINPNTLYLMLALLLCLSVGGMVSSILLIVGLMKNLAGCVLCFFVHGVVMVIILLLGTLMAFIHALLALAIINVFVSMIYIYFLVVVHSVYELMQRGKVFGVNQHSLLIDEEFRCEIDEGSSTT